MRAYMFITTLVNNEYSCTMAAHHCLCILARKLKIVGAVITTAGRRCRSTNYGLQMICFTLLSILNTFNRKDIDPLTLSHRSLCFIFSGASHVKSFCFFLPHCCLKCICYFLYNDIFIGIVYFRLLI